MLVCLKQLLTVGQFQQWHALLHTTTGDAEEILPVGFGESAVAFGNVGGDRQRETVELVGQEEVAARKALGQRAYGIGEGDGFLVDKKFFECEGHSRSITNG